MVVEEEKYLVANDGAATRRAELILVEDPSGRRIKVSGIEVRIAHELEHITVKLIRTGFGHDVDLPAAVVPVFSSGVTGDDPELSNRVEVGDDCRTPLVSLDRVGPVYHEPVLDVPLSAHYQDAIIEGIRG